jgi:hypothetical protein
MIRMLQQLGARPAPSFFRPVIRHLTGAHFAKAPDWASWWQSSPGSGSR